LKLKSHEAEWSVNDSCSASGISLNSSLVAAGNASICHMQLTANNANSSKMDGHKISRTDGHASCKSYQR